MFIFLRLLLAHFVGDYILQFHDIYKFKFKGLKGVVPHSLLIISSLIILCWPYLSLPLMWGFIFFIGLTHLFQDWMEIHYIKLKDDFWGHLFGQLMHIGLIMVVFLTSLKSLLPPKNRGDFLTLLYNNDSFVIYLIAFILATSGGLYLITKYKKTFLEQVNVVYSRFEKWYGIFERAVIVSVFFAGGVLFFLLPVMALLRFPVFSLFKKKLTIDKAFISSREIALSWTIAIITGLALFLIIKQIA